MPKAIHSPRHQRLAEILAEKRQDTGLSQAEVAAVLGRHQPFIANIESGERRVDVAEFLDIAEILHLNVDAAIAELRRLPGSTTKRKARPARNRGR